MTDLIEKSKKSILKAALSGKRLKFEDPDFKQIDKIVAANTERLRKFNYEATSEEARRELLTQITLQPINQDTVVRPPFNTDFGRHIFLGAGVFVNSDCVFVDLGGIYLDDGALIGSKVSLLSVNHVKDSNHRRDLIPKAVHIKRHAWVGAGAIVLPGVTVGENAIVGAGSVVTKDVAANTVVVGNPAKPVHRISDET
ncbi:MAG: DapH/DapD/GlmU-related protein [Lentilactobacillus hilgardii]|jgi:acetyltransferase-like isoleucine patch superfamily enzyme|uniref:DapH/DapD/GlmU-related protein n=1 Tax=Lentilactobacillus hilgardii TaxID=1588 RepID=UPI00019C5164|nr:DapH/DapD/GlmU-related protein [Lentilactobacillus hilgardii]EEI71796.1 bacterial transferase hexapeptide repeat protein [Lentilactobacillus hilgardii ATCC 27305]MBZ2202420.1 acetyltransferase [Lentilactobacillus hilgardii]